MLHTVKEIFEEACARYGALPAVRYLNHKEVVDRSYSQLLEDTRRVSAALAARGLGRSHIALIGPSSYTWITSYLGIINGAGVAVPLDAGLPAEELLELIRRSDAACVLVSPVREDVAERIRSDCPKVKEVIRLTEEGTLPCWRDLTAERAAAEPETPKAGDLCTIMFTSGTTGKSKGVMLTQQNLADNVESVYIDTEPGTRMLSVLPIHHAFCLVMDWLKGFSVGATVCINDSLLHMIRNMKRFSPRCMLMVPLMVETIYKRLSAAGPDVPKELVRKEIFGGELEYIFCGGARLDPFYIEAFRPYGVTIYQGYGMTECSPVISNNGQLADCPGSVGKPLGNCELRFVDGEIQVRGSSVMLGYYQMPEETAQALQNGWLCTGDLGELDENGFLHITGRKKSLIILSNGENISPEGIEGTLALEPLIGEIVITGGDNGLKAHIYPDPEVTERMGLDGAQTEAQLRQILDAYNKSQPTYRQLVGLDIRETPFEKSSTRKIKRNLVH